MRLITQKIVLFFVATLFNVTTIFAFDSFKEPGLDISSLKESLDSLLQVQVAEDSLKTEKLITLNEAALKNKVSDSNALHKSLALLYSKKKDADKASEHAVEYMKATQDLSIMNDHIFSDIKNTDQFKELKRTYQPKLGLLPIIYAFTGFFGFFIFVFLNSKKNSDKVGVLLISLFVLFHSLFILHLSLYVSRYNLKFPHALFASTPFSFLYGPLLYFYFKRVVQEYRFSWKDLIHLLPSVGLVIYLIPYYGMSSYDKFLIMFEQAKFTLPGTNAIIAIKILSLGLYAWATFRIYNNHYRDVRVINNDNVNVRIIWQRNILTIFTAYVVAYLLYALAVTRVIDYPPFLNLQIIVMVIMVFYIATISFLQPDIFRGDVQLEDISKLFNKYKKSGLTESYSNELKENLLTLMDREQVYKLNDISLDALSEMLGTTRHNASQVINEHFNMSFYDLINYFRINEAKRILEADKNRNFNIIDIAYEVGYNNKVTFNKAFKKQLELTPTEYIRSLKKNPSKENYLKRA
ncbi:helix-turn-helix domain-containing protein [Winogradskyella sp. 3972H.M.0a.05]|uniref:helix-turn-helix domain-containing protein n=1 Tax=Winogradskyella sp. 3972H.M.0a.05 TaxID=2950277 RepID=UPI003398A9E1